MQLALTGILPAIESFWGGACEHGSLRRVTIATGSDANYQNLRLEESKATCIMNMVGVGFNQNVLEGIHDVEKKQCLATACLPEDIVLPAASAPKKDTSSDAGFGTGSDVAFCYPLKTPLAL